MAPPIKLKIEGLSLTNKNAHKGPKTDSDSIMIPTIADGVAWCMTRGATRLIAHPYMLSPGRHATQDIPRLVAESMAEYPSMAYTVTDPLGVDTHLLKLIIKRAAI